MRVWHFGVGRSVQGRVSHSSSCLDSYAIASPRFCCHDFVAGEVTRWGLLLRRGVHTTFSLHTETVAYGKRQ